MIAADDFIGPALDRGFGFWTGVPCSFLTPLIDRVIGAPGPDYVGATSEGEAVAIASGAWLAGRGAVVMCQNSGLGNMVNPLTSLNHPFRIPLLLIVTWRGQPGLGDEPQHEIMGRITGKLLDLMGIPHRPFPGTVAAAAALLDEARAHMATRGLPFALILEKGGVRPDATGAAGPAGPPPVRSPVPGAPRDLASGGARPARADILGEFLRLVPDRAAVIASTGKCGRELFTLADRPQQLYQVGSMGGASAMALGVALNTARPVVVLDGDGAALMKLGNLATIGARGPGRAHAPESLVHIVLDNGVHDSTGGQATVSAGVDFASLALACGYRAAWRCDDLGGFGRALSAALGTPGPALLHVRTAPGSMKNLGRPTVTPAGVARRFRDFLASSG